MSDKQLIHKSPPGVVLYLENLPLTDLTPLRDLPIDRLSLTRSKVTDLATLRGAKVRVLNLNETAITDFSPLLEMPQLESVILPDGAANIGILRKHPTLKYLGWKSDWDSGAQRPKVTAEEFWQRREAVQKAGGK